mgnify:CR=1 FL=1
MLRGHGQSEERGDDEVVGPVGAVVFGGREVEVREKEREGEKERVVGVEEGRRKKNDGAIDPSTLTE